MTPSGSRSATPTSQPSAPCWRSRPGRGPPRARRDRSLAASVLAAEAGVAASTASHHLARLVDEVSSRSSPRQAPHLRRSPAPQVGELIEAVARVGARAAGHVPAPGNPRARGALRARLLRPPRGPARRRRHRRAAAARSPRRRWRRLHDHDARRDRALRARRPRGVRRGRAPLPTGPSTGPRRRPARTGPAGPLPRARLARPRPGHARRRRLDRPGRAQLPSARPSTCPNGPRAAAREGRQRDEDSPAATPAPTMSEIPCRS